MDSGHLDQEDGSSPETFSDSSVSLESSDTTDIFGDPIMHPRVGDQYQAEIPSILTESELLYLKINPADPKGVFDSSHSFTIGLSVPVMCVHNEKRSIKDDIETNGKSNAPNKTTSMSIGYCLVPGLSTDSWSDFEVDCFLLGLYMFGKNLLFVERFVDGKEMTQILAFYYGTFYGSAGYRRWSECRKIRNRKCVIGHRFFTAYRQQELFSRLLPRLSEESKTKPMEAARAFSEGRTTLYEYVSTLKDLVGMQALVHAVGIGKGKDDLTTLFQDSLKNSSMLSNRHDMPSSKACSSLTCPEIVNCLTGDFRLSKARSNDLFWEAVWPRLLARGWHSEQPRGYGYMGSKNCLVFLLPGIKKFSQRKLSKGEHYFNSVSDVLAKVAGEPELLELETDEKTSRPNGWEVEVNLDDDDENRGSSGHESRHCYLKPHVSSELSSLMKFTIVDTSLANEDNLYRVRELRSLPLEAKRASSTLSSWLRKNETKLEGKAVSLSNDLDPSNTEADGVFPTDHKSRAIKHQFSRRVKPGQSSGSGQVMKRRRLTSCIEAEEVACILSLPAGKKAHSRKNIITFKLSPSLAATETPSEKILKKSLTKKKPDDHKDIDLNLPRLPIEPENDGKIKVELERGYNSTENDGKIKVELERGYNSTEKPKVKVEEEEEEKHINPHSDSKKDESRSLAVGSTGLDQQPRRQSTRRGPLTTKALEALEVGFLYPVRHYRKRSPSTNTQDQKPKRVRQSRSKSTISSSLIGSDDTGESDITCNGKIDVPENIGIGSCELLGP